MMSRTRVLWFRIVNALLGRRVRIGRGLRLNCWLELDGPGSVVIGDDCVIDTLPGARRDHVTLFSNSRDALIQIGSGVRLFGTRVSCKHGVTIGDRAVVEDAAIADTDFHSMEPDRADLEENPADCRVVIGEGASIGSWSVISKGVIIGRGARVIAGSVVRKGVPDGGVVMGNPARPVPVQQP